MKRLLLSAFLIFGAASVAISCRDDDDHSHEYIDTDTDTISSIFETTVNLSYNSVNGYYNITKIFPRPLYQDDMVMVYRLSELSQSQGIDIWEPLPKSIPIEIAPTVIKNLNYEYDFTSKDINLYAYSLDFDPGAITPAYLNNQTFRIVIIPAVQVGTLKANSSTIKNNSYEEIIKKYNIDDSKVTTIK